MFDVDGAPPPSPRPDAAPAGGTSRPERSALVPDEAAARALAEQALACLRTCRDAEALEAVERGLSLCPDDRPVLRADLLCCGAEARFRENDYAATLDLSNQALQATEQTGHPPARARAASWRGAALAQMSRYHEALEALHTALALAEQGDDPRLAARALNYLGVVHEELGDSEQGLRFYERSLALLRDGAEPELLGRVLSNLGEAYVNLGRGDEALPLLTEAHERLLALGAFGTAGWCLWAIARVHAEGGAQALALECFEHAVATAQRGQAKRAQAETLAGLGQHCARLGDTARALGHLQEALTLAEEAGVRREVHKIHRALAEVYEAQGDAVRALRHHRAYHAILTEVYDEIVVAKVRHLTAHFELERARHEQEITRLRHVELAAAYRELEQLHARVAGQARELEELSRRDSLTGAYNRRHLDEALASELERARRYRAPLSVALLDIDHFKAVNDCLSHAAGDLALRELVGVLTTLLRRSDVLARYGGEEFALVLPETGPEEARLACDKLRRAVAQHPWHAVLPGLRGLTVSIGLACDANTPSADRLLDAADRALYEAKRTGRDRVCGP
jgi:diguanylate cyclase (GGDEF)-like protein